MLANWLRAIETEISTTDVWEAGAHQRRSRWCAKPLYKFTGLGLLYLFWTKSGQITDDFRSFPGQAAENVTPGAWSC